MMFFNDFIHKYKLKNKATSDITFYRILCSIGLDSVDLYLRHGPFSSDNGIIYLHLSKVTHWVAYISENYFDSYGCSPPQKLSKLFIKRTRHCLYSEHKTQGLPTKRDI